MDIFPPLLEELDGHLLLDISPLQRLTELVEGDHLVLVPVCLLDGALCDAVQLVLADVLADHHLQHSQQLRLGDGVIVIQVVHLERESELLLPAVEFIILRPLDGAEVRQHRHELVEVDVLVLAVLEEGVHNPVPQRVDGQLRDPEEVLPRQGALVRLVQRREATVETLDLTTRKACI